MNVALWNKRIGNMFTMFMLPIITTIACADELQPPKHSTTDQFGVNLAAGHPTTFVPTVSIGGDLGLSHSISTHTSQMLLTEGGFKGYSDPYGGTARRTGHDNLPATFVMSVFDGESSMEFEFLKDGQVVSGTQTHTSGYSYKSLGATGHTLTVSGTGGRYLDWVKPDGTLVRFDRGTTNNSGSKGWLHKIVRPNGFTVTIWRAALTGSVQSVTTNTGFQLKYVHEKDSRGLESAKLSATNDTNIATIGWDAQKPVRIVALNNAIEYCNPLANPHNASTPGTCTFQHTWPTASFYWPGGMPRAFHIGDCEFRVVDAQGGTTKYSIKAHDRDYIEGVQNGSGIRFIPRLVKVTLAGSNTTTHNYLYENIGNGGVNGHLF